MRQRVITAVVALAIFIPILYIGQNLGGTCILIQSTKTPISLLEGSNRRF
jgi:hypothetical protein